MRWSQSSGLSASQCGDLYEFVFQIFIQCQNRSTNPIIDTARLRKVKSINLLFPFSSLFLSHNISKAQRRHSCHHSGSKAAITPKFVLVLLCHLRCWVPPLPETYPPHILPFRSRKKRESSFHRVDIRLQFLRMYRMRRTSSAESTVRTDGSCFILLFILLSVDLQFEFVLWTKIQRLYRAWKLSLILQPVCDP